MSPEWELRNGTVRPGTAHAELRTLAEALVDHVLGDHLDVRAAVLDQRGQLQQREDVEAVDRGFGGGGVPVDDQQRLGTVRQPEERLLAAESPLPQVGTGEPAQRGADARRDHAEDDVAYVVSHGRAC
ncbi:hypothetical protein GCM10023323_38860 [Streptomyces thinghirensis]|uniref:Uncharacterized protein n=1 Tax=Streptomyces thinghirensis TaxID=551547 RepID=A0ABP9T464_9ACTN